MLEAGGRRSLGPVLLAPTIIAFSLVSAIPGISVGMGAVIIPFTTQLFVGLSCLLLTGFISDCKTGPDKV